MQTNNNEILFMPDVIKLTGFSRASVYRLIEQADFPRPFKIGMQKLGWKKEWVDAWVNKRAEEYRANY